MLKPACPKCSSGFVKRVSRDSFERLMSSFYIYPFRCQECGCRFKILQWGVRYSKIEIETASGRRLTEKQPSKMEVL